MKHREKQIEWFLEGELGDNSPWLIPVSKEIFYIGRLNTNNLILSSSSVSRKHAKLILQQDDLYITDLQSKNGTFVNGKLQTSKVLLKRSDLLKIGNCEFKVSAKEVEPEVCSPRTLVGINSLNITFENSYQLSERESEILYFLVKGYSLQKIGDKLFITAGTVKNHVLKIYKKTDSHSRIELSTKYTKHNKNNITIEK